MPGWCRWTTIPRSVHFEATPWTSQCTWPCLTFSKDCLAMNIQAIFFDLGETLVTSPRQWLPDAPALLASLKQRGMRLGIISNTGDLASRQAILGLLPPDFNINLFEPA